MLLQSFFEIVSKLLNSSDIFHPGFLGINCMVSRRCLAWRSKGGIDFWRLYRELVDVVAQAILFRASSGVFRRSLFGNVHIITRPTSRGRFLEKIPGITPTAVCVERRPECRWRSTGSRGVVRGIRHCANRRQGWIHTADPGSRRW